MFTLGRGTKVPRKQWTVMLYIAADHKQAERAAITEQAAIRDIKELEKVGSNDDVDILVQIDRRWPGYPERYWVKKDKSESCGTVMGTRNINDSGDPQPLIDFLHWARKEHPAEHAMLVLWGHAFGLGFGRDHGDPLTIPELARALKTDKGYPIDILGANACAMCYAEAAYELRDTATFLVAPEITMPFAGWPYDTILRRITKSPGIKPEALAQHIVSDFVDSFGSHDIALTLLDLRKAQLLGDRVTDLASALARGIGRKGTRDPIADAFLDTAHGSVRPLIDLVDLCDKLAGINDVSITTAAGKMSEFLKEGAGEFILKYKGDPDLEGLHGLGIFAPSVTGAADLTRLELSKRRYKELELSAYRHNRWTDLVYRDLKVALEPVNKAVAEFVRSTGATGVEQRTGVAQLLVSVHRSFAKLDLTLANTRDKVLSTVDGKRANGAPIMPNQVGVDDTPPVPAPTVRFGPPFLRLGGNVEILTISEADNNLLLQTVLPLAALEDALSNVERTATRVLTNREFGLGDEAQVKGGMGDEDQVKGGMGDEAQVKGGMGILPWLVASDTHAVSTNSNGAVAELYRQVAQALQFSEEAVAKIEGLVGSLLSNGLNSQDDAYKERGKDQVNRSFRELKEIVAHAKRTTGSVIAHPAYGLGPSPQTGLGTVHRQQLAIAGGLSPRLLRLL